MNNVDVYESSPQNCFDLVEYFVFYLLCAFIFKLNVFQRFFENCKNAGKSESQWVGS